jgi:hypothetical protein
MTRRLVISDLHFGSGDDLLKHPEALERLEPQLRWADDLLINGDLFELVFSSASAAIDASRRFFSLADRHVNRIVYIPGNHDYHFVSMAADRRRFQQALGEQDLTPFRVADAEVLLGKLAPNTEIMTAYPLIELDGVTYTHGHYISQHLTSLGWRTLDRVQWRLTGEERREHGLTVADYEALLAPLYELTYQIAQLPSGQQSQEQNERLLTVAAAIMRTPLQAGRQVTAMARGLADKLRGDAAEPSLTPPSGTSAALQAMAHVCQNLQLPSGPVLFGHTHEPLRAASSDLAPWHEFWNSGSWMFDRRERDRRHYRERSWPGTVLRVHGPNIAAMNLLDDCRHRDLARMIGQQPARSRRALPSRWRRPAAVQPADARAFS